MSSRVIYLQASFWQQLRADTSIAGLQCLMNVYCAISESELLTDISDEVWDTDEFLILLWKRHLQGKSEIELYESLSMENLDSSTAVLSAIYLTVKNAEDCNRLGTHYGIAAFNCERALRDEHLFKGNGFLLKKNDFYENRFLQFENILKYPCNAMIMIDPYILLKAEDIDDNIPSLFDVLLPTKKLEMAYHLSIFSMVSENGDNAYGQNKYEKICNLIKALRKGLCFDLTIYAIGKAEDFHSRMIITNNALLQAPDGFNVFRKNGKANKNAKFDIVLPRLIGDARQDMSNYLRWIKVAKTRSQGHSMSMLWGTKENRLFDLVK